MAVLLTDAPTDEFCQILATVESIDLPSDAGGPTNVYTGPETVDLLSLRIFALGSNAELTSAALQSGTTGEVNGVFTDPVTAGEPLKSSLVVLDLDTTPAVALLGGTITAIDATVPATPKLTADLVVANDVDVYGSVDPVVAGPLGRALWWSMRGGRPPGGDEQLLYRYFYNNS